MTKQERNKRYRRLIYLTSKVALREALIKKLGGRCCVCGDKRSGVLDFHHKNKNTKKFGISAAIIRKTHTIEEIIQEVNQCELLCSNCHSLHHHSIQKEEFELIQDLIDCYFNEDHYTKAKQKLLKEFWLNQPTFYPRKLPVDPDQIKIMYINENKSIKEIASIFKVDKTSLHSYLKRHKIPIRNTKEGLSVRTQALLAQRIKDKGKICTKCKEFRNLDEFWKQKGTLDNLHTICVFCSKDRQKQKYKKKKLMQLSKTYFAEHKGTEEKVVL